MAERATPANEGTVRLPQSSMTSNLTAVHIYDLSQGEDERAQTLRSLLRKGHSAVAPLRNPQLILHSHLPHVSLEKSEAVQSCTRSLTMQFSFSGLHMHWVRIQNS